MKTVDQVKQGMVPDYSQFVVLVHVKADPTLLLNNGEGEKVKT